MTDYSDLIEPESADTLEETALSLAQGNGLPVTSWQTGGTYRTLVEFVAATLADASIARAAIARGYVLSLSSGDWIDRVLESQYAEARVAESATVGIFVATDNGGGPHTLTAGSIIQTAGGLQFRVLANTALPLSSAVDVTVQAVAVGSAYNIPNGSTLNSVTSYPTVVWTNPEIGTTGTWILSLGADLETDAAAAARAPLKWATLATGSPPSAYLYWALSTSGVTRATVDDGNPDGANTVRVYVDNAGSVTALQATIDAKKPTGTAVTAMAAVVQSVTVPAVVTVDRSRSATAQAAASAALVTLASEIDIGGIVREAEIIERVMSCDGVIDFVMGSSWAGAPNIQLGADSIVQFTDAMEFIEQ